MNKHNPNPITLFEEAVREFQELWSYIEKNSEKKYPIKNQNKRGAEPIEPLRAIYRPIKQDQ